MEQDRQSRELQLTPQEVSALSAAAATGGTSLRKADANVLHEKLAAYERTMPRNTLHNGLMELSCKMFELAALYGLRAGTDHDEAPEGVRHLAPSSEAKLVSELAEAFGSYLSCVAEEKCFLPSTFGGLMHGTEQALGKAFGSQSEANEDGVWMWVEPDLKRAMETFAKQFYKRNR